jgi:predicted transposase YdaD
MMSAKSWYPLSDFAREHFGRGRAEGRAEGRFEGRAEGHAEGHREGAASVLRLLLTQRFGPLSAPHEQHLASADADTLLRWSDRLVIATSPDDVFAA